MAQSVDITMVIRKSATGMTVSVLPKSNGLKDEAQNHIVPLTLSGLPGELDAGFMNAIASPVRRVSGLLTNMAEFEKQADKAAANSKASKEQKAKETKEEKEKREKYEKHMKKAEELIAARNHKEAVTALIEVNVVPQSADGFDRIAERIYQYDEVESMYLMSGAFDLTVIISGRTLREVALFVSERLSTIQGVTGTATHFILKKYKEKHLVFRPQDPEEREYIFV